MAVTFLAEQGGTQLLPTRGTIVAWSPKPRARLVARLSDLDYTRLYGRYRACKDCGTDYDARLEDCPMCRCPRAVLTDRSCRLPAMITLTYPGDWVTVAPTAETVKRHLWAPTSTIFSDSEIINAYARDLPADDMVCRPAAGKPFAPRVTFSCVFPLAPGPHPHGCMGHQDQRGPCAW
jgi:hypothetical protein